MTLRTKKKKPDYPVFRLYKMDDLVRITNYTDWHLMSIRDGSKPANKVFRKKVSGFLGRPERELFGKDTTNG